MFMIIQDWIEFSTHDDYFKLVTTYLLAHQDGFDLR